MDIMDAWRNQYMERVLLLSKNVDIQTEKIEHVTRWSIVLANVISTIVREYECNNTSTLWILETHTHHGSAIQY